MLHVIYRTNTAFPCLRYLVPPCSPLLSCCSLDSESLTEKSNDGDSYAPLVHTLDAEARLAAKAEGDKRLRSSRAIDYPSDEGQPPQYQRRGGGQAKRKS